MEQVVCALDVGSGSVKLLVGEADASGRLLRTLHEEERETLVKQDAQDHGNRISPAMEARLLGLLRELRDRACAFKASRFFGCCTAVFRGALNGEEVVRRLEEQLHVGLRVVTQEREAQLGFLTGLALAGDDGETLCVWDAGGASFQLSCRRHGGYCGDWGSVNTAALLRRLQGREHERTVNPVTPAEAERLARELHLPDPDAALAEAVRSKRLRLVCIGGVTSMFRMLEIASGTAELTLRIGRAAVERLCNQSDEEIRALDARYQQIPLLLPKLVLFCAVLEALGVDEELPVSFFYSTGSCQGIVLEGMK